MPSDWDWGIILVLLGIWATANVILYRIADRSKRAAYDRGKRAAIDAEEGQS